VQAAKADFAIFAGNRVAVIAFRQRILSIGSVMRLVSSSKLNQGGVMLLETLLGYINRAGLYKAVVEHLP
jgi:hypothetical protein